MYCMQCFLKSKNIKSRTLNNKNRWIIKKVMVLKKLLPHLATRGTYSPARVLKMRWSVTWANIGAPSSDVPAEVDLLHMRIERHAHVTNQLGKQRNKLVCPWASYQIRKIAGCAWTGNAGNVFSALAGKRSRYASRHVRHARAVMHAGIAN